MLLGPSGCGKTTCLRIVAGLETATEGRVEIAGRDVTDLPPAARGVAMVFQSYALFPHLNVAENIVFGLKARRVPAPERARRLARAVEILGIGHLLERKPGQLSGGQQQRVALGRAIVAETPVCLMDEPLSNLDAQLRADMRREILALQRRLGITMLYVTHDQTEAMGMADQIVLLRDGHIEQDAPPAEIYARPGDQFRRELHRHAADEPVPAGTAWRRHGAARHRRPDPGAAGGRRTAGRHPAGEPAVRGAGHRRARSSMPNISAPTRCVACTVGDVPLLARLPGRVVPGRRHAVLSRHRRADPRVRRGLRQRIESIVRSQRRQSAHDQRLPAAACCKTAGAALALPAVARAADAATEISFYFPVAVGGPITKIIDGYAADFQRENPSIKVTPIYAGTYQDTLTKAQTALKANAGPQMAVLLSTDVFSLIDDDLIVPFDTLATSDADRAWLRSFYPAFLKNGEINGHTWGVPFQRSTIVLYWNKAAFQDAGLDPERPPATWDEHAAFAQKLTKRNGDTVDAVGRADPRQRLPVLAVPGTRHRGRRHAGQCRWHRDRFRQPRAASRRCATGSISSESIRRIRPASSIGAPRRAISWSRRWR